MKTFVVMTPPGGDPEGLETRFIRDGFAPLAFIFPVFWFLWHRMWLWAGAFFLVAAVTNWLMATGDTFATGFALSVATSLYAGLEGNRLRASKLEARGWTMDALVDATSLDEAEEVFFAKPAATGSVDQTEPDVREKRSVDTKPGFQRPAESFGMFEWNGVR